MRLILLFSTFPVRTETFLQREVEAFIKTHREIELWTFWGGEPEFNGRAIHRLRLIDLWLLLLMLPYWFLRTPRRFFRVFRNLFRLRWRNGLNFCENLLGFGYGIILARKFEGEADADTVLHAVWASLPATIAWTVHELTGIPFSFSGHAYDLFEDGGDALIREKIEAAFALRTSTEAGGVRFLELGAHREKLTVVRRGFSTLPEFVPRASLGAPLRIAVVGRFVPKMGYDFLADVLDYLFEHEQSFEISIIGDGPEKPSFENRMGQAGWAKQVKLFGSQPFSEVLQLLSESDVLLFTGVLAKNGDQAGFPNIIAEAMAIGCSVVSMPVGGVTEVVRHSENGYLADSPEGFHRAIAQIVTDEKGRIAQRIRAREWVEANFNADLNMGEFWDFIESKAPEKHL